MTADLALRQRLRAAEDRAADFQRRAIAAEGAIAEMRVRLRNAETIAMQSTADLLAMQAAQCKCDNCRCRRHGVE